MPRRLPARVTLFVTEELAGKRFERAWREVAEEIGVYRMPGDHATVITEHIHVVARQLKECSERAQAGGTGRTDRDAPSRIGSHALRGQGSLSSRTASLARR